MKTLEIVSKVNNTNKRIDFYSTCLNFFLSVGDFTNACLFEQKINDAQKFKLQTIEQNKKIFN